MAIKYWEYMGVVIDTSDDLIYQKYRYIVFDIDISYRIISSKI